MTQKVGVIIVLEFEKHLDEDQIRILLDDSLICKSENSILQQNGICFTHFYSLSFLCCDRCTVNEVIRICCKAVLVILKLLQCREVHFFFFLALFCLGLWKMDMHRLHYILPPHPSHNLAIYAFNAKTPIVLRSALLYFFQVCQKGKTPIFFLVIDLFLNSRLPYEPKFCLCPRFQRLDTV